MSEYTPSTRSGPLGGVKIVEFAGLGPGPFCGMILSDLGADVVRIDRPGASHSPGDVLSRGRRSVVLDLKSTEGVSLALAMIERAEILYEGFRPGVMEQLGLGPEPVLQRNPSLVYGRITGWGQTGPLAHAAGHDINYVALSGALGSLGTKDKPFPPLNLLGDMGGGGMSAAIGLLAALTHARATGKGQVVDCAITEAASTLMAMFYGMYAKGRFNLERGTNMGDGASHFYNTYECSDGKWISVGSIEPVFYETLVELTGFQPVAKQWDRSSWPEMRAAFGDLFLTRSRNEWCRLLEGTDACFAPVLDLSEAPEHPHCLARESYVTLDGVTQPAPMPRFSHTPALIQGCPPVPGSDYSSVMEDWNL